MAKRVAGNEKIPTSPSGAFQDPGDGGLVATVDLGGDERSEAFYAHVGRPREMRVVSPDFTSWNPGGRWLRLVEALRAA